MSIQLSSLAIGESQSSNPERFLFIESHAEERRKLNGDSEKANSSEENHFLLDENYRENVDLDLPCTRRPKFPFPNPLTLLSAACIKKSSYNLLLLILPSFIRIPGQAAPNSKKLHPTSYLDGVRGVAALVVVIHHSVQLYIGFNHSIFHLPFLGLFAHGMSAVAIFFVVSGFSLSLKPLKLLRAGDMIAFIDTMVSSMFRRHLRLFLPVLVVSFLIALIAHLGLFPIGPWNGIQGAFKLTEQLTRWWSSFVGIANPLRPMWLDPKVFERDFIYDLNLWTIPIEFRGSMVVFQAIIAFAKARTVYRLLLVGVIALCCLYNVYWDIFLFLAGILLAEIHLIQGSRTKSQPGLHDLPPTSLFRDIFWALNLTLALYILSIPLYIRPVDVDPGFKTIWSLTPPQYLNNPGHLYRFWPAIGSVYLIVILENAKIFQMLFTNSFSQYLGRISFSLYLVHGTIIRSVGWNIIQSCLDITGVSWLGRLLAGLIIVPLIFWVADLVTTAVDERSVRFTRWMYTRLSA